MKKLIIKWLLKMLGHRASTQEIKIDITCDPSQTLESIEKVRAKMEEIVKLQKQSKITL